MSISSTTSVAARLCQTDLYRERPKHIEKIETHTSHVFLTDRFAYKLKKPICLNFLDFSTLEKRQAACEAEVRLNRRLAPEVYLATLPITVTNRGRLSLDGPGLPVDWVVKMKRLPVDRRFDLLLTRKELTPRDLNAFLSVLITFYKEQPPITIQPDAYRAGLHGQICSNWDDLLDVFPEARTAINRIHAALVRFLSVKQNDFAQRVCDGRIIDGHGDLRPEHVYLTSPPAILDCLEFDDTMRQVDILDDLSFFAMECDKLNRPDLGQQVVQACCQANQEIPPASFIAFYKALRACIRAKTCILQGNQNRQSRTNLRREAETYLTLGQQQLLPMKSLWVIVVFGLSGTGKSTLARGLADLMGASLLQTDQIRQQSSSFDTNCSQDGSARYDPTSRQRVYDRLQTEAKKLLEGEDSLVIDGTFLRASQRNAIRKLAITEGSTPIFIQCQCSPDVAMQRIQHRLQHEHDASDAVPKIVPRQTAELEVEDRSDTFVINTESTLADQLQTVMGHLEQFRV